MNNFFRGSLTRFTGMHLMVLLLWLPIGLDLAGPFGSAQPAETAASESETADQSSNDSSADSSADQPAETEPAESESAESESAETQSAETDPAASEANDSADAEDALPLEEAATSSSATDAPAAAATGGVDWGTTLLILAALVVPIFLGNWLGGQLNMPDHGWKIATILTTFSAAALACALGEFKGGPDLAGGTTLIYELADASQLVSDDNAPPESQIAEGEGSKRKVTPQQMSDAIRQRIDPAGQKEVVIQSIGDAIEIIIPKASEEDREFIKRRITDLGQLEFRITADPTFTEDRDIIERAKQAPSGRKIIKVNDRAVARWVPYNVDEFGPVNDESVIVKRLAGKTPEALVMIDRFNVTGEYLTNTFKGFGMEGPEVRFNFDSRGARRFGELTGTNLPKGAGAKRKLGILLDNRLISAPNIISKITDSGQISGRNMTEQEVDNVISVLNAGSLPAELNKTPLSEETVSPTLGAATIEQGKFAITVSLAAVLIFMALYYRFAGLVACLALVANLLLVLGTMVMMDAAFTLPGLAGLVLTVGMSVDANVLIFERIREELKRGAALRMAIRNGFGRATTTIVDANVTTLIAGVVLYVIGTGPIKGFAVTLILGILMSMYTAIFCSRVVFDIAERRGWIKSLNFSSIVGETNIDFIGKRHVAMVASIAIIAIGLFGVVSRQGDLLNIDFTGGTSVTMALAGEKMTQAEVDAKLRETAMGEENLVVVERGTSGTRFTVNSALEMVEEAEEIISETFAGQLQTYKVDIGNVQPYTDDGETGANVQLTFNEGEGFGEGDGVSHDTMLDRINRILKSENYDTEPLLTNDEYLEGSSQRFKDWTLRLSGLNTDQAEGIANKLSEQLGSQPIFPLANKIGGKVAGNMQWLGIQAIVFSLLGIIAYIWFRFQNLSYGLAAVVALVHDVLVTLGAIAVSAWIVSGIPALATALQIDAFQISLPILAAFLTVIGYSLNDTIVVFDRIREVRGKSPDLRAEMINTSINQTLSRTLLTSLTTLIVVAILYFFGGAGIHGFAFALVIGVLVGTYSSIFIASPALLAMTGVDDGGSTGATTESSTDAA